MEESKKTLFKNIIYTILYAVFTLIIVLHHETWADEAQVWLLAKHLSIFDFSLFKHLVNEGHPSFFYILMMPFAKMNMSIIFMQIFCWICMVCSVFLFLQYSPFNKFAKFSIITSAGFLYFFPVIARSYSILPLLVFLLAILYPKSNKHPFWYAALIFMLANTHIIMLGFCGLLTLDFLYKNLIKIEKETDKSTLKKYAVAFGVMCLGLLAVVLQLHGTTSSNVVIKIDTTGLSVSVLKVISQFFINSVDNQWPDIGQIMFPLLNVPLIMLSVILYIVLLIALLIKNTKLFLIAFFSILFQLIIYILGYNHWIFVTRIFCAHIILIFCLWLMLQQENISAKFKIIINSVITLFFIFTLMNGIKYSILDIKYNYSGAKETAQWIKNNIDKNTSVIITDNDPHAISVVYYLNGANEIYSAQHEYNIKYVVWDKKIFYILDKDGWDKYAKFVTETNPYFKNKKIYALVPFFDADRLHVTELKNYKPVYESHSAIVKLEGFRIYEYIGDTK